jgi:hypothetical protein
MGMLALRTRETPRGSRMERLRGLIEKVLQDPSYRERADYFQKVISKTRGLDVAADIIKQALQKYQTEVPRDGAVLLHEENVKRQSHTR